MKSFWLMLVRRISQLFAVLLSVSVLALLLLLFTSYGGPWALQLAERLSGGQIKAVGVQGGLLDRLQVQTLTFKTAENELTISNADLVWAPKALLIRELHIQKLSASSVVVQLLPSEAKPFRPLPEKLPLKLVLDDARVGAFTLLQPVTPPLHLQALEASVVWDGEGLQLRRAAAFHEQLGGVGAAGKLRLQGDAIVFQPLIIAGPGDVQVNGTLGLNGRVSSLKVAGERLRWPVRTMPVISASALRLEIDGLPEDASLQLSARLLAAVPQGRAVGKAAKRSTDLGLRLTATAKLGKSWLDVLSLKAESEQAGQGRITGKGKLLWAPSVQANADLAIEQLNPALLLPEWPGQLNGRVVASTAVAKDVPKIEVEALLARSRLRGKPFNLDGKLSYLARATQPELAVQKLVLSTGSAKLVASGAVMPVWAAKAGLNAGNLADLYPGLAGRAEAKLELSGKFNAPRLKATVLGNSVKLQTSRIGKLQIKADIDLDGQVAATLQADDVMVSGRALSRLEGSLTGTVAKHRLSLRSQAAEGSVAVGLSGGFDAKTQVWKGSLSAATVDAAQAPKLALIEPAALLLSAKRQVLERACFSANRAELCLAADRFGLATKADVSLSRFDLALLQPLMPKAVLVKAIANGKARVQLSGQDLQDAEVSVQVGQGQVSLPNQQSLALQSAQVSLLPQGKDWALKLDAISDRGTVEGSLFTPRLGGDWPGRALRGQVGVNLPSITFLQGFAPGVEALQGKLQGALLVAGSLGAPKLSGRMQLSESQFTLPAAGIKLTQVEAVLLGDAGGNLSLMGSAHSGEGVLQIKGTGKPAADGLRAELRATGSNLLMADLSDYRVWASPDLLLKMAPDAITLTGRVEVPKAEITPRKLVAGAASVSRDTVVVGREKTEAKSLPINAEVTIALGKEVRFSGFGLKARIEGEITARDAPGIGRTRGRGELRVVEGRYKAYGQDLKLETGRLLFAGGPIDQPAIDFRAVRQLRDDFWVAVLVRGTLNAPLLDLSSSQSGLTREEMISWLVLGRPLSTANSAERNELGNAALALGLSGGDFLAEKFGKAFGIDDIKVGAEAGQDVQQAGVTIGKYLSPRLYVSYGVGLFGSGNVFKLLYDLGRGFKLRTETGLHAGGDLLYTVEK